MNERSEPWRSQSINNSQFLLFQKKKWSCLIYWWSTPPTTIFSSFWRRLGGPTKEEKSCWACRAAGAAWFHVAFINSIALPNSINSIHYIHFINFIGCFHSIEELHSLFFLLLNLNLVFCFVLSFVAEHCRCSGHNPPTKKETKTKSIQLSAGTAANQFL